MSRAIPTIVRKGKTANSTSIYAKIKNGNIYKLKANVASDAISSVIAEIKQQDTYSSSIGRPSASRNLPGLRRRSNTLARCGSSTSAATKLVRLRTSTRGLRHEQITSRP